MANLVGAHQLASYVTPVNNTLADATVVRGNDNTTGAQHNAHDADPTIHVQQSVLASRPAAGAVGGLWYATDANQLAYDTGGAWVLIGATFSGGTVPNATTFSALLTANAGLNVVGFPTVTNGDGAGHFLQLNANRIAGVVDIQLLAPGASDIDLRNDGAGNLQIINNAGTALTVPKTGPLSAPNGLTVTNGGASFQVTSTGVTIVGAITNTTGGGTNTLQSPLNVGVGFVYDDGVGLGIGAAGGHPNVIVGGPPGAGGTSAGIVNVQRGSLGTPAYQVNGTQVLTAQITGWGSSTNGSRGAVNGSTATLPQVAAALAQLLIDLRTHGMLGA